MILYKYYGYSAGLSALKSHNLGFREAQYFNDPFDLTYIDNSKNIGEITKTIFHFKTYACILSLTRNPYNPLMWAHYGDEHRGFCIGYDVNDDLLTSQNHNLINVKDGSVIYTTTKENIVLNTNIEALYKDIILLKNKYSLNSLDPEKIKR